MFTNENRVATVSVRWPPDVTGDCVWPGLGRQEFCPDLFQPYGGFPDGVEVDGSYVTRPELPGIGFKGKADLYREMKALAG